MNDSDDLAPSVAPDNDEPETQWCLDCGGEFVVGLDTCPDCGAELVAGTIEEFVDDDEPRTGKLEYDLAEWATESRVMVQQLMRAEDIPHAWQGTTLMVPAAVEARTDLVLDQVEATTLPTLDPDADKVAYELDGWSNEQIDELCAILDTERIAFEFDTDGDLVVEATDDPRVEAVIDAMAEAANTMTAGETGTNHDDGDADQVENDGDHEDDDESDDAVGVEIDAGQLLSDLFVAADRLARKAADHEGVLGMVDGAALARSAALPYGFETVVWADILMLVNSVCDLLEDDESEDEQIVEAATTLREVLRQYV